MPVSRHSRRRRGKLPAGPSLAPAARTYGRTAALPAPAGGPSSPPSQPSAPLLRTRRAPIPPTGSRSEHRRAETSRGGAGAAPPPLLPVPPGRAPARRPGEVGGASRAVPQSHRRSPRGETKDGAGAAGAAPGAGGEGSRHRLRPSRGGSPGAAPGAVIPPLRQPPPARHRSAG